MADPQALYTVTKRGFVELGILFPGACLDDVGCGAAKAFPSPHNEGGPD